MIYVNPLKRAIAIVLCVVLILAVQGVGQIAVGLKMRSQPGWYWLIVAEVIALCASAALVLKFQYTGLYMPSAMAGISLLFAGFAYIAIAMTTRKLANT